MIDCFKCKKMGLFLGGVLFGTAGVKILGSDDAKKLYINCLAAGLRAKDCVMTTASISRRTLRIFWQRPGKSMHSAVRRYLRMKAGRSPLSIPQNI